jgi:hypothetical protein
MRREDGDCDSVMRSVANGECTKEEQLSQVRQSSSTSQTSTSASSGCDLEMKVGTELASLPGKQSRSTPVSAEQSNTSRFRTT